MDCLCEMTTLTARQQHLIQTNIAWLDQALELISAIDDRAFAALRVGNHLRHIVDFYECFLDGVEAGQIDYDARRRDERVERSRSAASEKIRTIADRLRTTRELSGDAAIFVRMEDAVAGEFQDPCLLTSVARELQVLSSHTIHHFALIAMMLRQHGYQVDANFGVAPSTLRYQSKAA